MRIDSNEKKLLKDKNYQIARFISLLIALQGLYMAFMGFRENNSYIINISFAYSLAMFVSFLVTTFTKKPFFFYVVGSLVVLLLESNFLIKGGTEGFGVIWLTLIPLFSVYIFSFPVYVISNTVYLLLLILFMWTPLKQYAYNFSDAFSSRFPLVYFIEAFFGGFLQHRISKTQIALQEQKYLLYKEIQQAQVIQESFYGKQTIKDTRWNIANKTKPMAGVSGDLYDIFTNDNKLLGFGVYDISGHGISSGILTLLAKNIIDHEFSKDLTCPLWETVTRINDRFIDEKGEISNYMTGITVKTFNDSLEIVNAAHPAPFIYRKKNNTIEQVKNHPNAIGPIGLKDIPVLYESVTLQMESGDELIIYTDGILEAQNPKGELFGEERLNQLLLKNITKDIQSQLDIIIHSIKDFRDTGAATDDITVFIIQKV